MPKPRHNSPPFKTLSIGDKFTFRNSTFRKASTKGAFRLKPNGTGETHAQVPFARNTHVKSI